MKLGERTAHRVQRRTYDAPRPPSPSLQEKLLDGPERAPELRNEAQQVRLHKPGAYVAPHHPVVVVGLRALVPAFAELEGGREEE